MAKIRDVFEKSNFFLVKLVKAVESVKLVKAVESVKLVKAAKSVELENGEWKMKNGKWLLRELRGKKNG